MAEDKTCVYKTNGEPEAQQVKAFLEAHGIPCTFRGESLRMTHGFTLDGLGVVRICVPPDLVEQARDLLERADSGELRLRWHEGPEATDADAS